MPSAALALTYRPLPHLRLLTMTDANESPPPSDERDTDPPDPSEELEERQALATMLPEQRDLAHESRLSEATRADSVNQLLRMYSEQKQRDADLLDPTGRLAQINEERAERIKRETIRELSDVVDKVAGVPIRDLKRTISEIVHIVGKHTEEIRVLRDSQIELDEDLRRALAVVECQLKDVMAHFHELKKKIEDRPASSPNPTI